MRTERVLVGVAAEAASQTAVDWVIQRARERALSITLITASDLLTSDPAADDARLARTAQRIRESVPGAEVVTTLTDRSTVEGLIDLSGEYDLLVLGAHPDQRVLSALTGSLPFRVAARALCTTVIVPADWKPPRQVTPAWLAARPLIANDSGTRLSRQTAEWFAAAGERPQARIALNYNDAMKSLVAAGYGAALLPHEAGAPLPDQRISMRPLRPALSRALGIAHRARLDDGPTELTLRALLELPAR